MSDRRLVVETAARARRRRLLMLALGAFVLLGGWGLYHMGRMNAPSEVVRQVEVAAKRGSADHDELVAENRRLKAENERLSERLTVIKRSAEVDEVADSELHNSLNDLQSRVAELKKELAFYRSIVSPDEAEAGLRVQAFRVDRSRQDEVYRFHLTLIQAMRHEGSVAGSVRMRLEGLRDGESVSLDWSEIALDPGAKLVFSFKYFQELGAAFRVPDNLEPTLVEVEVAPEANGKNAVTETFRWQEVIKARG